MLVSHQLTAPAFQLPRQPRIGTNAGLDRRYVAKIECGAQNPSFWFLRSISISHKISLDWLLYGVGEKFIKSDLKSYDAEIKLFKKFLDNASKEEIEVITTRIQKIIG